MCPRSSTGSEGAEAPNLSVGVVHGIDAIRKRAAAGQPMKAWDYYSHHNLWDAYKPFVQEAHDDRLELLHLLDAALRAAPPSAPTGGSEGAEAPGHGWRHAPWCRWERATGTCDCGLRAYQDRAAPPSAPDPEPDEERENGDCECGQDMDSHSGGFALMHHDMQMRHTAPYLREALERLLSEEFPGDADSDPAAVLHARATLAKVAEAAPDPEPDDEDGIETMARLRNLDAIRERDRAATNIAPYSPAQGWPDGDKVSRADRRTLLALVDALLIERRAAPDPEGLPSVDVDVLRDAALDVESGYINRPDRTTRTYWSKIAARYEYLAARLSPVEPTDKGAE